MSRMKLFIPLIIFVVLAVIFARVLNNENYNPQDLPSALIGQTIPAFSLPALENDQVLTEKSLNFGSAYLLNVWATWCVTCRVEHPYLMKLEQDGVKIVGLNYKDNKVKAQEWLRDLHNPYVVNVFDEKGILGLDLGVYGAPETYIIDKNGIIRYKHVGDVNPQVWQETLKPIYEQWLNHE